MAYFDQQSARSWNGAEEARLKGLRRLDASQRLDLASMLMAPAPQDDEAQDRRVRRLKLGGMKTAQRLQLASGLLRLPADDPDAVHSRRSPDGRRLWPLLGGPGLRVRRHDVDGQLSSLVFPYRCEDFVTIAFLTCSGLRELGARIGHEIHAVRPCAAGASGRALSEVNEARYGALYAEDGDDFLSYVGEEQPGYDDWAGVVPEAAAEGILLRKGPVSVGHEGIHVNLPKGLDRGAFAKRMHAVLERCRLATWMEEGEGYAHCVGTLDIDPNLMIRGTRADDGSARPSRDIVLLDAKHDVHRLARLVEDMCIRFWLDLE